MVAVYMPVRMAKIKGTGATSTNHMPFANPLPTPWTCVRSKIIDRTGQLHVRHVEIETRSASEAFILDTHLGPELPRPSGLLESPA